MNRKVKPKATRKVSRKPKGYKKLNGGAWIRKEKRFAIYLRDKFICNYCGTDLRDAKPSDLNLDHIICRGLKGCSNEPSNLITACRSCNSSRQDKRVEDFATGGALDRIKRQVKLPINLELAKAILADKTGRYDR